MTTQLRIWFKDARAEGRYSQIEVDFTYLELLDRLDDGELIKANRVIYEPVGDGTHAVIHRAPVSFSKDAIARMEPNPIPMAEVAA